MAFGQQSGPPASQQQVRRLLALVEAAGHSDFRDARGPLRLTQRQAGGKFTRDEADELIERLEATTDADDSPADDVPAPAPRTTTPRTDRYAATARKLPTDVLAAELQRRGWVVMEP